MGSGLPAGRQGYGIKDKVVTNWYHLKEDTI